MRAGGAVVAGMALLMGILVSSPAEGSALRTLQRASAREDARALLKAMDHKSSYARELAARSLGALPPSAGGTAALTDCLGAAGEQGYVRATCANTLAIWQIAAAAPDMIAAMAEVDAESRYWIAHALHVLNTPTARAHLASLTGDADLFLATSAREWTR